MKTQIIIIFCFVDDYLKAINFQDDRQAQMSSAEIITVTIAAARFFGGNHEKSKRFFHDHNYIKNMLSKSQFNRRLHAIDQTIWEQIFYLLGQIFKARNKTQEYAIDSFPVPVCDNFRISRCNIYNEKQFRGYIASKKRYFFGIRVHMICTVTGEPVEIIFAPGSVNDAKIFKEFELDLPEKAKLYGDGLYNDYIWEDIAKEALNIDILPARKSNMKKQHEPSLKAWINRQRKNIETTFSMITAQFPKKIHAVTAKGFELKVFSFILSYSIGLL
jgi:uncharacterized protein YebE (UPF0316 family)